MPAPTLPPELLPATWDKLKVPPAIGRDFADELKAFSKADDAVPRALLDVAKLATAAAVGKRIEQLRGEPKASLKALADHGKQIASQGRKLEAELKKNAALAKTAAPAAAKAASAAPAFVDAVSKAFDEASATLAKLLPKLQAAEAEEEDDEDGPAEGGFAAFAKPRVVMAMRNVRKNEEGGRPVRFMLVVGNHHAAAFLGFAVSPSMKNKLSAWLKEQGDTTFKSFLGTCIWEANAYTFVGDGMPVGGGLSKRLKSSLFDLTGLKYKLRLRNEDGEVDATEDDGDEERGEGDAAAVAAAAPAAPAAEAAAAPPGPGSADFNARLLAMQPRLKTALAVPGTIAQALKLKIAEAAGHAKDHQFTAGMKALDQIEQLLAAGAKAAPSPAGPDPAAVHAAFRQRYEPVRKQWDDAMETVNSQIARLQSALRNLQDEELADIAEFGLPALTGNHRTPMIAALMQLDGAGPDGLAAAVQRADRVARAFAAHVENDVRIEVTDDNDFGVPMTIRRTLGGSLRDLQAVFATVR